MPNNTTTPWDVNIEEEGADNSSNEDSEIDEVQLSDHYSESNQSDSYVPVVELSIVPIYTERNRGTI